MSWDKIEDYLFEKYCVEGEDKELCKLMEKHDKEIRCSVVKQLKDLVNGHKYINAEDGTTIEQMLNEEETEKKYAWYLSQNQCCDWMLHRLDEIIKKEESEIG